MRKKRLWSKRFLALTLSAVMAFGSADVTVLATENDTEIMDETVEGEEAFTEEDTIEATIEAVLEDIAEEETVSFADEEETIISEYETEETEEATKTEETTETIELETDVQLDSANDIDSGVINNISWVIDKNGKLTVSGSGDYYDSDGLGSNMPFASPWYQHKDKITSAEVRVTDMTDASYMFQDCGKLTQVDFSGFVTDNLKRTNEMFSGCGSLTSLDLSMLHTDNVVWMNGMFSGCSSLTSLDLGSFQTGNVKDMSYMFNNCSSLTSLNLSSFQTDNVEDMACMFSDCSSLTSLDLSSFQTDNVTDMRSMFFGCSNLSNVNLSSFHVKRVTTMELMFKDCSSLTSLDLSHFDTEGVTDVYGMFDGCRKLTDLKLSKFKTDNVDNLNSMFRDCNSLTELDLSSFDTTYVYFMSEMFSGCEKLAKLTIGNFHTENVTTMEHMFLDCGSLTELDLSGFDTENVTNMEAMFNSCQSLKSLDLKKFDTKKVTNMNEMFTGCTNLTELDLSSFDLSGLKDDTSMFLFCDALKTIYTPCNLSVTISLEYLTDFAPEEQDESWYQGENVITELPKNLDYSVLITKGRTSTEREAYITATKKKTVYECNDVLNLDDLKVQYYGIDGKVTLVTDYTTNKDSIDMSVPGTKELNITYKDKEKELVAVVSLTVKEASEGNIAEGSSEDIAWKIDSKGKLTVTGSGDYERTEGKAPWYNYRARIKTAEINVTDMTDASWMFAECVNLTVIDVSRFDTKDMINMSMMFYNCRSLAELDLSSFNTGNVENMSEMFGSCINLTQLDLSSFNTGNVEDMSSMFAYCSSLMELDLNNFETGNVNDMFGMFSYCNSLKKLSLGNFNTGKVTDISGMFAYCSSLLSLDISSFDLAGMGKGVEDIWIQPLEACDNLLSLRTPKNCSADVQLPGCESGDKWYDENGKEYFAIPNLDHSINLHKNDYIEDDKTKKTVTYDMQGHGAQIGAVTVNSGEKLTTPTAPIAEGYTFGGWYKEAACINAWDFDKDTVTADMTLYAKWTKNAAGSDADVDNDDDSTYTQDERVDLNTVSGTIANIKPKVYDGNPYEPTVKVTVMENGKKKTLTEGTDYRVSYANNINAEADGTVTVKGNGIYKGKLTASLIINPKPLKKVKFVTGGMAVGDRSALPVYLYDGAKQLTEGMDYSVQYDKNLTAQQTNAAMLTVTGLNNYTGSVTAKLTVYEGDASQIINPSDVTLSVQKTPYTGKAIKTVEPQVKIGAATLQPNKDYKVQYQNNKDAGTAFVVVTGKGAYKGKVVKSFEITPATSGLEIKSIPEKTYNGKLQKPSITVTAGGKKLSPKKDYSITYTKNLHAGAQTAQVLVMGKGNYAGAQGKAVFTINPQKIAKASVKGEQGSLTLTYSKRVLKEGTDYTLQYGAITQNKVEVTITGKGDFTGSMTKKVNARASGGNDKEDDTKEEASKEEVSKEEASKEEASKEEASKEEASKEEASKEEASKEDDTKEDEKERAISEKLEAVYKELNLDSLSQIKKIETIYDYVIDHVAYDSESEMRYTLYGALVEGKAVCNGYALLMERMLTDNGISSRYIAGIGLSCTGGPARHAWNIVEYNGFYYNIDATWDHTETTKNKRGWFMKSQTDFEDHVRDPQYETESFMTSYPMAKRSYGDEGPLPKYENAEYTFNVAGGGTVSTSTVEDKKTAILIFGRVTCGNTMSFLSSLKEKELCKDNGIKIIFADVDKNDENAVSEFKKKYGTEDMYFCYDTTGGTAGSAIWQYYYKKYSTGGVFTLPLVVVIDSENTVRFIQSYPVFASQAEECLDRLEE